MKVGYEKITRDKKGRKGIKMIAFFGSQARNWDEEE